MNMEWNYILRFLELPWKETEISDMLMLPIFYP